MTSLCCVVTCLQDLDEGEGCSVSCCDPFSCCDVIVLRRCVFLQDLDEGEGCSVSCCDPFSPSEEIIKPEDDYFTAPFQFDKLEM